MNIAYLSYWGIDDGLSKATVLPNIEILSSFENVSKIYLFSIERTESEKRSFKNHRIQHIPLYSRFKSFRTLNKVYDFLIFPSSINKFIKEEKIDLLICRGAPAGAIGLKSLRNTEVPLIVESFEPHAEYMLESGVWSNTSLSYNLEKKWEAQMKIKAKALLPVSKNYQSKLESEGIDTEIYLAPCCVNLNDFKYESIQRELLRKSLEISEDKTVGIYVGKFGDIYLKEEFFDILREVQNQLGDRFYFIILSPQNKNEIIAHIEKCGIDSSDVKILEVDHKDVPNYLSASDYGLVTVKPSPHRMYCSPIKTGEYWANGLPVLITKDIGDDSEIISHNKIGAIIDLEEIKQSVITFIDLLDLKKRSQWVKEIVPIAEKYRNFDLVKNAYQQILEDIEKS